MEFSIEDLSKIAKNILDNAAGRASPHHATLIAFSGDLGAGKTTMIKEIARQLGVGDDLQSPTFVIYKIYKTGPGMPWKTLVHADLYRLETAKEIFDLGWQQLLDDPDNLMVVEWPSRVPDAIPAWAGTVTLEHAQGETRNIDISK